MHRTTRIKITDLNPHLICVLCGGYYVDATTIIECLHSFCKTCIVRYLETSKYCPICDVQVHKTKPLLNIRSDQTLQDIVYKLIPGLFQNEMKKRREFYAKHPEAKPSNIEASGDATEHTYIYSPDEAISLSLEYNNRLQHTVTAEGITKDSNRRYLRCPAAVTVIHLKKLIRAKYGLSPDNRVDILYGNEVLCDESTLMDIAYTYMWKRKGPLNLYYRIFENPNKRIKLDLEERKGSECAHEQSMEVEDAKETSEENKVSEATESPPVVADKTNEDRKEVKNEEMKKPVTGELDDDASEEWKEVHLQISENGIMSVTNIESIQSPKDTAQLPFKETIISSGKADESTGKEKEIVSMEDLGDSANPSDKQKQSVQAESEGKSSEPPSDISKDKDNNIKVPVEKSEPAVSDAKAPVEETQPKVKEVKKDVPKAPSLPVTKKSASAPMGYKTLKTPPKSWNPSIPRTTVLSNHSFSKPAMGSVKSDGTSTDASKTGQAPAKPPRFFKMRHLPRYLGNPSSGVKPMFQVHDTVNHGCLQPKQQEMVMKIDPKTLCPIVPVTSLPANTSISLSSPNVTSGNKLQVRTNKVQIAPSTTMCDLKQLNTSIVKGMSDIPHNNNNIPSPAFVPTQHTTTQNSHVLYNYPSFVNPSNRSPGPPPLIRTTNMPVISNTSATVVSSSNSCISTSALSLPPTLPPMSPVYSTAPGYHSSLPPSISMILNQHRPQDRSFVQAPPTVQRVPANVHAQKPPQPSMPVGFPPRMPYTRLTTQSSNTSSFTPTSANVKSQATKVNGENRDQQTIEKQTEIAKKNEKMCCSLPDKSTNQIVSVNSAKSVKDIDKSKAENSTDSSKEPVNGEVDSAKDKSLPEENSVPQKQNS